jgi:hypothetical protein
LIRTIKWNTESAAVQRFRRTRKAIQENRKKNKKKQGAPSPKLQAASAMKQTQLKGKIKT